MKNDHYNSMITLSEWTTPNLQNKYIINEHKNKITWLREIEKYIQENETTQELIPERDNISDPRFKK